jgi:hypothetical protein
MRFCVYQGITTLINSAYKNRGHAQVVATNLKQMMMYNLTMSYGRVLLDILRYFLNYEKIITARMHAKGNDDVDNKTSDEMTRKMGKRTNRATTHTWAHQLLPQATRFKHQVRGHGDWRGCWRCRSMPRVMNKFACCYVCCTIRKIVIGVASISNIA